MTDRPMSMEKRWEQVIREYGYTQGLEVETLARLRADREAIQKVRDEMADWWMQEGRAGIPEEIPRTPIEVLMPAWLAALDAVLKEGM